MIHKVEKQKMCTWLGAALLSLSLGIGMKASADEAQAKVLFKAMSDYMAKQSKISFDLDTSLDVVTTDQQKISVASSSAIVINRPDKIHVTRKGGFADVEFFFNGKTVSLLLKDKNLYAQSEFAGSIDTLVEELRTRFQRPLPAADLLGTSIYNEMMPLVVDIKDLGSGVIRGVECDHLAFRTDEVDWQIWIAQGKQPYPMRFIISSPKVAGSPQYQVDVMNFKTGNQVAKFDFSFTAPKGAKQVLASELADFDELPDFLKPRN